MNYINSGFWILLLIDKLLGIVNYGVRLLGRKIKSSINGFYPFFTCHNRSLSWKYLIY